MLLTRVDASVPVPSYAHPDDAGVDLSCTDDVVLGPGERAVVGTGVAVALPPGYAGFVHPRSGLAARAGLSVVNTPGTVDSGYRGEIRVCLINHDPRAELVLRAAATGSRSWWCNASSTCGSSRSRPCRSPCAARVATAPPAATSGFPVGVRDGATGTWLVRADEGDAGRPGRAGQRVGRRPGRPGDEPGARTIGALALKRWAARGPGRGDAGDDIGAGPPTHGPFDEDDVGDEPVAPDRVDFGAVRVPVPRGGEVSVEPEDGRLQAVHVMLPAGRLSVSALAAPRTERLWPDLAAEIDESLREGGATVRSFTGEWGRELHARTGDASSLFVGVDGPRWMLYGVATGPTSAAAELDAALRRCCAAPWSCAAAPRTRCGRCCR